MSGGESTAFLDDQAAFGARVEGYRHELQLHCYRMLGSLHDSEDLVQETFLRAWRRRDTFTPGPGSSLRAWLYRIATNACLDALAHRARRVLPYHLAPAGDPHDPTPEPTPGPWLEPYPDVLLEGIASPEEEPSAAVVARETVELAFVAAIQLLPARQRAVLILRDVLGWSAKETAGLLDTSVAAANSALQRARATLQEHLPERRLDWAPVATPTEEERAVLDRFIDAFERSDAAAFAALLREDAFASMPPLPLWFEGRDDNVWAAGQGLDPASPFYAGEFRAVPVGANLQPAAAFYLRAPGDTEFRAFAIDLLRIEDGQVVEITSFGGDDFFAAFGLPATLE